MKGIKQVFAQCVNIRTSRNKYTVDTGSHQ